MARKAEARKHETDTGEAESHRGGRAAGPAGRSIWTGSISFGLLQIPISLYTAENRREELHFRMLDKHDHAPIRFERVNANTGKKVEWNDIVKGFEYEPDTYVVLDKGDLEKANVKATQTIDIQDFVPGDDIEPEFFDTPYFVVPQPRAKKAYVLLRQALEKRKAAAIATFVLRTRQYLCALMPVGDAILLETLRFGHELKDVRDMPLPSKSDTGAVTDRELTMAEQLIDGMMTTWDPSKYRDQYYGDVMKIIEEKAKTGVAREHHARLPGKVATDVVDLLALLKKSVAEKGRAANEHEKRGPGVKKAHPKKRKKKVA